MLPPPPFPTTPMDDPLFPNGPPPGGGPSDFELAWAERQRRQRTLRVLMMFLMMLLLMDGEEPRTHQNANDPNHNLRYGGKHGKFPKVPKKNHVVLDGDLFGRRVDQDDKIHSLVLGDCHARKQELDALNRKQDMKNVDCGKYPPYDDVVKGGDGDEDAPLVYDYPRNVTGYYRGEWQRMPFSQPAATTTPASDNDDDVFMNTSSEQQIMKLYRENKEDIGVFLLPPGYELRTKLPEVSDLMTSSSLEEGEVKKEEVTESTTDVGSGASSSSPQLSLAGRSGVAGAGAASSQRGTSSLTESSGRAAFQIYMKSIPGMSEISLIDGFVKLYDGSGISTRRDMLLRAKGVIIHGIGRLSLVANADPNRSLFYIRYHEQKQQQAEDSADIEDSEDIESVELAEEEEKKRRLLKLLSEDLKKDGEEMDIERIREIAINLMETETDMNEDDPSDALWVKTFESPDFSADRVLHPSRKQPPPSSPESSSTTSVISDIVTYPYVHDDKEGTEKSALALTRSIPSREQALQANAASCEFEINLDIQPEQLKAAALLQLHIQRRHAVADAAPLSINQNRQHNSTIHTPPTNNYKIVQEPLVMSFTGQIVSPNCQFVANINATALRIDWESTTGKAINYSFYMMLTCLTQIVVLLRQLLHTQAQSAASRVSLLCIGWQTVLDAILCIAHILLCLMMQPLFTAFASVAFFKLLIFCVIEMKYMAIIMQARASQSHNNANTPERLRQQVTQLHIRFYIALFSSLLAFWYIGRSHLPFFILLLYSFWVPQILQNIVTEAKRPLHSHYIYGMTFTRLVAPMYMFAVPNNFLKEANPDFPRDLQMCYWLGLWVCFQAMVLICQGKYGARFMIPARFLPPKFDYSRPIPSSLLPPSNEPTSSTSMNDLEIGSHNSPSSSTSTTRNRNGHHSSNKQRNATIMTEESPSEHHTTTQTTNQNTTATLDCVICYNPIDTNNRRGYMLAPCDHIFHRPCLEQWMDVKMECPICRTDLPPI